MAITFRRGFTIVEILVVIVVIGILATVSTVAFNGVQQRAANTTTKSDAIKVADQLELLYIKTGKFPLNESELAAYSKDSSTDWDYVASTGGAAYCLELWSTKSPTKRFTIRDDKNIEEGTCTGWVPSSGTVGTPPPATPPPSDPNPTIASVTSSSFVFSWSAVTSATSYTVHLGTTTSSGVPNGSAPGCSSTAALTCTATGLSPDTNYYVGLSANVPGGSNFYGSESLLTKMPAPTTPGISFTGPTRVKLANGSFVIRYVITGTGGSCSVGTRQWKMGASPAGTFYESWSWVSPSTNNADVPEDGYYSAYDVRLYARPRCVSTVNPTNVTEGSTASATYGNPGAGGGDI